jgi:hypothetical protein
MQTLKHGRPGYRTSLLTQAVAQAFARCVEANTGLFTNVWVERDQQAQGEKCWRVSYEPANEERAQEMRERWMRERVRRAMAEGPGYLWHYEERDGRSWWEVDTPSKLSPYNVRPDGGHCSCPDATARMAPAGLSCKHMIAFALRLGTTSDGRRLAEVLEAEELELVPPPLAEPSCLRQQNDWATYDPWGWKE